MKLFEGDVKSVKQMTDEELHSVIAMLRQMRASSLIQATKAVKRRSAKEGSATTKRIPKTIDLDKLKLQLTPEQLALFEQAMVGKL